ncbi:MAG TPA: ABC transporter substrate-binding protein, partial [Acidimicrobiia bacterium]|nr:ABC transporter substrate-binding protein [Acidimicrobiia bacterium]
MSSTNGHRRPRCARRSVRRALAVGIAVATLVATALVAPGAAQTGADSTGVTAKEIKVGFIFSKAGLAGSTFENAADGFEARVKEENAKGGVNGRKIVPVIADDSGATNNLVAAQNLVQNEKVFLVVNNSPFAFLGYRFLLDNNVPMVGGGFDGNEYGQPGNEKLISILGNNSPVYGAQYKGGFVDLMKKAGAKNVGV